MARQTYDYVKIHCVLCTKEVPADRLRFKAITCSKDCADLRKKMIRVRPLAGECMYCHKPSTLEDRAAFQRFRKLETKRPDLLYPDEFEAWKKDNDDGTGNYIDLYETFARDRAKKAKPNG